jgi:hypothetical protein
MQQNQYHDSSNINKLSSKYETEGSKTSLTIQPFLKPKISDKIKKKKGLYTYTWAHPVEIRMGGVGVGGKVREFLKIN